MAYAAVISLKQTIHHLQNSSRFSILPPGRKILQDADDTVKSLQEALGKLDYSSNRSKRLNALDEQITEEVCKLWNALESHVSEHIFSHSEDPADAIHPSLFTMDLHRVKHDIDSFIQIVKKMEEEYVEELSNPSPEEEDEFISSRNDFSGKKLELVGLSKDFDVINGAFQMSIPSVALVGMAGIGKTTLAQNIFHDSFRWGFYQYRAWVTVGPKPQLKKILLDIISQLTPETDELLMETEEELVDYLYKRLKDTRYMIVLDDLWHQRVWDDLMRMIGYNSRCGRVLVTTRLREVANRANKVHQMGFLNDEESWSLLRDKVFGKESCPQKLEKVGKKISENCQGLPLLILAVAKILFEAEKTLEYWNKAAHKTNSVFTDANDRIFDVLFRSYEYLPQHLKACFLYMAVFPLDFEIPCSKLTKLWSVEGFLDKPIKFRTFKDFVVECLKDIGSSSLVIVRKKSSNGGIKTCSLHCAFWHMCIRVASQNKFFRIVNSREDAKNLESQRRLCIHNSNLLIIKDVYSSIADSVVSSLLFTGPHHEYPIPIYFNPRLLKIIDALAIRFYEFPIEISKLFQLQYLALTLNYGKVPPFISELWNLQFLIVHPHLNIKPSGAQSYLPMEIWDMKELKHIQIMGSDLPDPFDDAFLPNLITLLEVSSRSCTKSVVERLPNLEKLGIRIELSLDDDAYEPSICFDHVSHLDKLESLKCVIVNPKLRSNVIFPNASTSPFPKSLKKLSLSGLGCPWEDMKAIALLPNLKVLKLQCYAFRGQKWVTGEWEFQRLRYFLIEDTDLVQWIAPFSSFQDIRRLIIKHCYKLEDIPIMFRARAEIEVVDCNPLAVTVKQQVRVKRIVPHYSWVDEKFKS